MSDDFDDKLEKKLGELGQRLRQERDELKLKVHLAKMDAKQEWEVAESKWEAFESKFDERLKTGKQTTSEVQDVLKELGDDISNAYRRIRDLL